MLATGLSGGLLMRKHRADADYVGEGKYKHSHQSESQAPD
jgi:hypothetical protein